MTLLVALKGRDGLVLAADSRGTFGNPTGVTAQNDSQVKAHVLTPHVGALAAGSGELSVSVLRSAEEGMKASNIDGVTSVMTHLRDTARACYASWFPHIPATVMPGMPGVVGRPDVAYIVAGYDPDAAGKFTLDRIYQLPSNLDFPPMLHEYGFALAGIAQYGLYLLNRLYESGRSLGELTALAVYVITETASQDGKVGGPVRLITISPDQGCRELEPESVVAIQQANQQRSEGLKQSFYRS